MYVKLFNDILQSSLWDEDNETRIVWITLLALADEDGMVHAVPSAIARMARIEPEATQRALEVFQSPDSDSRSSDFEGRRIDKVEGGFLILNYMRRRRLRSRAEQREETRLRVEKHRKRKKEEVDVTHVTDYNVTCNKCNDKQKQ